MPANRLGNWDKTEGIKYLNGLKKKLPENEDKYVG